MYAVQTIEDAFVTALTPLKDAGTLRTLETYGGQLNEADIEKITLRFPAIYVVWGGSDIEQANRTDNLVARVSVLICEKSLRGQAEARRGATESPGVYALMEQARALLHRQFVLDGWTPARLVREAPLLFDRDGGLAVYEAQYQMKTKT